MIIKTIFFFALYFFLLVSSLSSQVLVDKEAKFLRFQNYYLGEKNQVMEEDFILSQNLYAKRNRDLVIQDNHYYLKPNSFLKINISHLLPGGQLHYLNKVYLKDFHIFIKENPLVLKIENSTSNKKLHINVDDTSPIATLFLINFFRKKNLYITNNPQTTLLLADRGVGIKESSITLNKKKILPTSMTPWFFSFRLLKEKNLLSIESEDLLGNRLKEFHQIVMDNQGPQIKLQIKEEDKIFNNFIENNYFFAKDIEMSFLLQDNYSDNNQLYVSENMSQQSFALLPTFSLRITEEKTIYFYAKDQLGNISAIRKITFKKKENRVITIL